MAGRPATVRGGGLTGVHYLAFSMSGVALVMLVITIVVATQLKDAQVRATTAENRTATDGTPPAYYVSESQAQGKSTFTVMEEDVNRLAKLATGQNGVAAAVEGEAQKTLRQISEQHGGVAISDSLLNAASKLSDMLAAQKSQVSVLQEQINASNSKNDELTERLKKAKEEYDGEVAKLAERVEQINAAKEKGLAEKDKQLNDLQQTVESTTQEMNNQKQTFVQKERDYKIQVASLGSQVNTLQKELAGIKPISFDPGAILTKADGKILRAIPGSDVVYINIGSSDKLKVGMGFEVYSASREAPKSYRGKASIEVVSVADQTAECRVLRSAPGQPIIEGDPVVNIAYERGRQPKFVVVGDYDLNYDGNIDFDGLDKVKGMIRQWGGTVVDDFNETVDFVVIGQAPEIPQSGNDDQISAVVRAQADEKTRALQKYRDLINKARAVYVPVINQNQFLFLTGFAGDTTLVSR